MTRSVIDKVGYFSEEAMLHGVEDYDMWLRMSIAKVKIKYMADYLGSYVIHGSNMSNQYEFYKKIENLHISYAKHVDLKRCSNKFKFKLKLIKLYCSKIKTALSLKKFHELKIIFKDILFVIINLDKYLKHKE